MIQVKRQRQDYEYYKGEEILGQFYPCFPIKYYRPRYTIDKKDKDEEWGRKCSKLWSEHQKFSPGLFTMLCSCPDKKIYGFQKLVSKESPKLMTDFVTCRTERTYNPKVFYDASCIYKEHGLNRETRRFMRAFAATEPFHEPNHSACLPSFKSTNYDSLGKQNREGAEQFNALLQRISGSIMFMSLENYLNAVTVFCALYNLRT